jgi:hypothetical protein
VSLRDGRAALLIGVALHVVFVASLFGQFLNPLFVEARHASGQAADYFGIYTAGEDLIHGRSIYSGFEDHGAITRKVPYFYFYRYLPPTAYGAGLTALVLSPWAGYIVWVILTELLLLIIVRSILRLDRHPPGTRRVHAGLWLGFFPFYLEQWMGQFSFLMAAFLWVILRPDLAEGSLRGRFPSAPLDDGPRFVPSKPPFWAWAASIALKSYTALFAISLLRRRQWRPVLLCAGLVLVLCGPYWLFRPEDVRQFLLLNFRPLPPNIHGGTLGASTLVRLLGWNLPAGLAATNLQFGGFDVRVGNLPVFLFGGAVLAATLWAVMRHGKTAPLPLQLALWVLAFFLIFKDVWEYHYVMMLPVVTALALIYRSRFVLWMGLLLALPTPYWILARPDGTLSGAASLIHHASKAGPAVALYVWALRLALDRGVRDRLGAGAENVTRE